MPQNGGPWSLQAKKELHEELTKYKEERELTKSDTVRKLVRQALEQEQNQNVDPRRTAFQYLANVGAALTAILLAVGAGYFAGIFTSAVFVMFLVAATIASNGAAVYLFHDLNQ